LALTGGRMGYGTWLLLAMMFTVLRWRRLIFVIPVAVMIVIAVVPAARDRMFYGFGQDSEDSGVAYEDEGANLQQITSDRILIWEIVIDRIGDKPLIGYGRHGHFVSGAAQEMRDTYGERKAFPHPHNAYLELVLDNGFLGAFPIFFLFYLVSRYSIRLFTDRRSNILMTCGGFALASITGQLIASVGGQSFYPRAGVVMMWCSIGLALRAYVFLQELGDDETPDAMWEKVEGQTGRLHGLRHR
jgi:O-antigen ligase